VHELTGKNGDGAAPLGDLVMDSNGVLYGATDPGGRSSQIYSLTPPTFSGGSWTKTALYTASAGSVLQGSHLRPPILGKNGELYSSAEFCAPVFRGCVFELAPPATVSGIWTLNILHIFQGAAQADGAGPGLGKLAMDSKGNLYGATQSGGVSDDVHAGTVYKLTPPTTSGGAWVEQILYKFQAVRGGFYHPQMNVAIDSHGALYGSTRFSQDLQSNRGPGVVYRLSPPATPTGAWMASVIGPGLGCQSELHPCVSQLTVGPGGTVFGTDGAVFAIKPPAVNGGTWTVSGLAGNTGFGPGYEVVRDAHGRLYGTDAAAQTIYRLSPPVQAGGAWTRAALHTFVGGSDGSQPFGRPFVDASGHVFASTLAGGTGTACVTSGGQPLGCGTVFELQ
jgi:hypothetical protein